MMTELAVCYSAEAWSLYDNYTREFGAEASPVASPDATPAS